MAPVYPAEVGAIVAGGVLGTLARTGLSEVLPREPGVLPWATLAVNLIGALLLGLVLARQPRRRALLGTGLCGALTTFSTLQLELYELLEGGHLGTAAVYAIATLAGGLAAVRFGRAA